MTTQPTAQPPTRPTAPDPAADRSRWIALYVLCTGVLMIVLDVTVVNVALPSIQTDLGFTDSSLAWVVNAYLVPFGGLLLLAGRLSDLIGRKVLFVSGLVVFVAASALCGLSGSQEMLIAARFLQGIGGALASAVVLGMIVTMFPEPREQAKAIGTFTFVAVAGGTIGLLVGGALTEGLSWHWIFFVNVPVGVATVALATRLLDRDRGAGLGEGADLPGATLITTGVMLSVYTIVKAAEEGWASAHTLVLGAISVVLLGGFFVREATARSPLMPLSILRAPNVAAANAIMGLSMVGFFGIGFLGALYLQKVLGYSPVEVGFAFLPATLIMGALSLRYTERTIGRFGPKAVLTAGMTLVAVSLVLFARVPVQGDYVVDVLPALVFQGLGAGLAFPALMMLSMSGAAPDQAGLASGLIQTTQQVAGALGLAVIATLSAEKAQGLIADGRGAPEALTSGYHLAFVIGGGAVVIAVALAALLIKAPPGGGHGAGGGADDAAGDAPAMAPMHV